MTPEAERTEAPEELAPGRAGDSVDRHCEVRVTVKVAPWWRLLAVCALASCAAFQAMGVIVDVDAVAGNLSRLLGRALRVEASGGRR